MPNINDLNDYITPQDVRDGDVITFEDAGEIVEVDYSLAKDGSDIKSALQIHVKLPDGKVKLISPNKTSRTSLSEAYTPMSENWIGKSAKVCLVKQNVRGTLKQVIYLEPANGGQEISDQEPKEPTEAI